VYTIPPISTKQITSYYFKPLNKQTNNTTYVDGNPGPALGQAIYMIIDI
jgi:hypothetical protein